MTYVVRIMENAPLQGNSLAWMILFLSKQARYVAYAELRCISHCISYIDAVQFTLVMVHFMQIVKPRPMQAASIPGMLSIFQNVGS